MNAEQVYEFRKKERIAVLATVAEDERPQAALMGMAVTARES
jgi:hypothetical protein